MSPLSTDVVFLSFGLILFTKPTYTSTSFIDLAMSSLPISKYVNELEGKQINFKESSETSCLCKSCECLKILNNHCNALDSFFFRIKERWLQRKKYRREREERRLKWLHVKRRWEKRQSEKRRYKKTDVTVANGCQQANKIPQNIKQFGKIKIWNVYYHVIFNFHGSDRRAAKLI